MQAQCPICDGTLTMNQDAEVSEMITCTHCKNKLEVTGKEKDTYSLKEAPKVEEDWGE